MLFTVIGIIIGGVSGWLLSKRSKTVNNSQYRTVFEGVTICCGMFLGGMMGLGFDTSQLVTGNHPFLKILGK